MRSSGSLGGKAGVSRLGVLVHPCSAWVAGCRWQGVAGCRGTRMPPWCVHQGGMTPGEIRDREETRLALSRCGESAISPGGSQADFIGKSARKWG